MEKTNRDIAIEIKQRLSFYLVALVFTVLGLSIQTATFGKSIPADISELLGWLFLLGSGLAGIVLLEVVVEFYTVEENPSEHSIKLLKRLQNRMGCWEKTHKTFMFLGFAALVVSRSYLPIGDVIKRLWG